MKKIMCIDYELCTGCTTCQMACSLSHEGECSPKESRIQIVKNEEKAIYIPVVCRQCEHPACLTTCPVGAIHKDLKTEVIHIDQELCDSCGICVTACPYGAVSLYPGKGTAFVCDLCGGKPKCVEVCGTGVLRYCAPYQFAAIKRRSVANDVIRSVLKSRNTSKEPDHE